MPATIHRRGARDVRHHERHRVVLRDRAAVADRDQIHGRRSKQYQGTWEGTYSNNQKFKITVSDVNGFRAQVKYQSGTTTQYQQVLIGNSSFRVGDTKFVLTGTGKARSITR